MNGIKNFWSKGLLQKIIVIFVVIVVIGGIGSAVSGGATEDKKGNVADKTDEKENNASKESPKVEENIGAFDIELGSGHYEAGVDIPKGTYTLTAISGTGNVSSSNMYSGGLNEMMGVDNESYIPVFNNMKMNKGVVLSISGGVRLALHSDSVDLNDVKARNVLTDQPISLGSGNYVAGTDFEAGVYNVVAVSGSGNVSSDNMFNGGINAIMGISDLSLYETEYKNITFKKGTELTISGVQINLIPVK